MVFRNTNLSALKADLNKKYLSSGLRISGDINDDKLTLCLVDDYGKHSSFMNEMFFGRISKSEITGNFRMNTYVIVLLIILFAFAVESVISAFVLKRFDGLALPIIIIAAEILYLIWFKRNSRPHNQLITNFLNSLSYGEEFEDNITE